MKPLAIALSEAVRGFRGRDDRGDLTNIQCKPIQNCHNESLLCNEYIIIRIKQNLLSSHIAVTRYTKLSTDNIVDIIS
jgi:hypothetical protein